MQMNQIIRIAEHSAPGRYIGAGRDTSGPTAVRIISFIYIIATTTDYELERNNRGIMNGRGTPVGPDVSRPAPIDRPGENYYIPGLIY